MVTNPLGYLRMNLKNLKSQLEQEKQCCIMYYYYRELEGANSAQAKLKSVETSTQTQVESLQASNETFRQRVSCNVLYSA